MGLGALKSLFATIITYPAPESAGAQYATWVPLGDRLGSMMRSAAATSVVGVAMPSGAGFSPGRQATLAASTPIAIHCMDLMFASLCRP